MPPDSAFPPPRPPVSRVLVPSGAAEIEVHDVVDYAQRISGITSAPSYWKPGMAMVGFAPPAPRPEMMRAGALSAFAATAPGWFDRVMGGGAGHGVVSFVSRRKFVGLLYGCCFVAAFLSVCSGCC